MGLTAKNSGGDFELAPVGNHPAVCVGVIDLGMQTSEYQGTTSIKHQCRIDWELPTQLMDDGRPFTISKFYTVSTGEKSNMARDFQAWRGRDFTEAEAQAFDVFTVAGKACLLNCVGYQKLNKDKGVKVASISPLPKEMKASVSTVTNPIVKFALEDYNNGDQDAIDAFEGLSDWFKDTIKKAHNFGSTETIPDNIGQPQEVNVEPDFNDEIPF